MWRILRSFSDESLVGSTSFSVSSFSAVSLWETVADSVAIAAVDRESRGLVLV